MLVTSILYVIMLAKYSIQRALLGVLWARSFTLFLLIFFLVNCVAGKDVSCHIFYVETRMRFKYNVNIYIYLSCYLYFSRDDCVTHPVPVYSWKHEKQ